MSRVLVFVVLLAGCSLVLDSEQYVGGGGDDDDDDDVVGDDDDDVVGDDDDDVVCNCGEGGGCPDCPDECDFDRCPAGCLEDDPTRCIDEACDDSTCGDDRHHCEPTGCVCNDVCPGGRQDTTTCECAPPLECAADPVHCGTSGSGCEIGMIRFGRLEEVDVSPFLVGTEPVSIASAYGLIHLAQVQAGKLVVLTFPVGPDGIPRDPMRIEPMLDGGTPISAKIAAIDGLLYVATYEADSASSEVHVVLRQLTPGGFGAFDVTTILDVATAASLVGIPAPILVSNEDGSFDPGLVYRQLTTDAKPEMVFLDAGSAPRIQRPALGDLHNAWFTTGERYVVSPGDVMEIGPRTEPAFFLSGGDSILPRRLSASPDSRAAIIELRSSSLFVAVPTMIGVELHEFPDCRRDSELGMCLGATPIHDAEGPPSRDLAAASFDERAVLFGDFDGGLGDGSPVLVGTLVQAGGFVHASLGSGGSDVVLAIPVLDAAILGAAPEGFAGLTAVSHESPESSDAIAFTTVKGGHSYLTGVRFCH